MKQWYFIHGADRQHNPIHSFNLDKKDAHGYYIATFYIIETDASYDYYSNSGLYEQAVPLTAKSLYKTLLITGHPQLTNYLNLARKI